MPPRWQIRPYSTVRIISQQLRSFFDSYNHSSWTVMIKRHNRPCLNPLSTTSAILYDRNCYDRNCFPTVKFCDYRPFSSVSHCPRRTQSKQGTVQRESAASALPAAIVVTDTVAAAVAAPGVGSQRQHCGHHHCGEEAQSSSRPGPSLWCDPLQPS